MGRRDVESEAILLPGLYYCLKYTTAWSILLPGTLSPGGYEYCVIRPEQRSNKGQIGWQFRYHITKALCLQRAKVIEGSESQSLQEQSIGYSISTGSRSLLR